MAFVTNWLLATVRLVGRCFDTTMNISSIHFPDHLLYTGEPGAQGRGYPVWVANPFQGSIAHTCQSAYNA